jgi:formylglycine-generating enzyme required for sulfatase activity
MMRAVPAGTVNVDVDYNGGTAGNGDGPFSNAAASNVPVSAFYIGETEVTYQLWKAVYDWAVGRGYSFANPGRQGGDNSTGPVGTNRHPVTTISWRDAVVWCNAYSEAMGRTPVYYFGGAVLRQSEGDSVAAGNGKADKAVINTGNGYRLPSSAEWEYAARGGVPSSGTPWTYIYAGSNTEANVAWYNGNSGDTTQQVGGKTGNSLGLRDMSGNVLEWCWDLLGVQRVTRGGSWHVDASDCAVARWVIGIPNDWAPDLGFRVVCP